MERSAPCLGVAPVGGGAAATAQHFATTAGQEAFQSAYRSESMLLISHQRRIAQPGYEPSPVIHWCWGTPPPLLAVMRSNSTLSALLEAGVGPDLRSTDVTASRQSDINK